jgi:hypothetical protein
MKILLESLYQCTRRLLWRRRRRRRTKILVKWLSCSRRIS